MAITPFSWAAQPGAWVPSLSGTWSSFQHLLSNWSEIQLLNQGSWRPHLLAAGCWFSLQHLQLPWSPTDLNFLSPGLYNNLTSTYFLRASQFRTQFNPSTVKVISWYSGYTCYLHRCISYFWQLGRVGGQYARWPTEQLLMDWHLSKYLHGNTSSILS